MYTKTAYRWYAALILSVIIGIVGYIFNYKVSMTGELRYVVMIVGGAGTAVILFVGMVLYRLYRFLGWILFGMPEFKWYGD